MRSPYYLSQGAPSNSQPTTTQISSQYSSQQGWSSAILDPSPPTLQYNWSSTRAQASAPAYHSNPQHLRQHSYPFQRSPQWAPAAFSDTDSPLPSSYRPLSRGYTYSSPENNQASPLGTMETVPPPLDSRRPSPPRSMREHPTSSGRASGDPPMGISRCSSCKATTSSEWRKGPSGKKDLCNAYVFHFRVLMRVFFLTPDLTPLAAGCGSRGRRLKRKGLRLSDAAKTRSWHWPSKNRLRAGPLPSPLSRCHTITCGAGVMTMPFYQAQLALRQGMKRTPSHNLCMVTPTTISPRPHHPLQAPSRFPLQFTVTRNTPN